MDVSLEYFIVRVRERRHKPLVNLSEIGPKKLKLIDLATEALAPLVKGNYRKEIGKTLSITDWKPSAVGFHATMYVGEYGTASRVIDVTTGAKAFDKTKVHAEEVPYFLRLHVPVNGTQGILILQRLGLGGIGTLTRGLLRDHVADKCPDYILDVQPMVPDFVMGMYLDKGSPKAITFVKNSIPADIADGVSGKAEEKKGRVEVTVKSSEPTFFQPKKLRAAKSVSEIRSVYAFDDFEPDEIKMKVTVGGKTRTVSLMNKANLRASFDITEKVSEDASGYPHPKDVRAAAQEILAEVAGAAGVVL